MPWPVFPSCPAYGFTKRADYSVTIIERGSGVRSVNRNWYYPLHVFTAVPIDKSEEDMGRVARFWHAIGGQSGQFRFKDYTDFSTADNPSDTITNIDQPMVQTDDDPDVWQLMKLYVDEEFLYQQQRIIQKPVIGTLLISDGGSPLTAGVDYTVDYETGLVTFAGSVANPQWGGQFHVPAMFESIPEFMIANRQFQQTNFAVRELRLSTPELVTES